MRRILPNIRNRVSWRPRVVTGSAAEGERVSSVSQYGITWAFDKPYLVGQFVNGDYWVLDEGEGVVVTSVSRPNSTAGLSGGMVDPLPGEQGYDNRVFYYNSSLDVPRTGLPYTLTADSSWVQTVSFAVGDSGYTIALEAHKSNQLATVSAETPNQIVGPTTWGTTTVGDWVAWDTGGVGELRTVTAVDGVTLTVDGDCTPGASKTTWTAEPNRLRPKLRTAAILTCLGSQPSATAFRPAYAQQGSKTIYDANDIVWANLPSVAPAGTPPSLSTVERYFERPWIDNFAMDWVGGSYLHPLENLNWYGREMSGQLSDGYLMLTLNTLTNGQKETLLYRLIQIGIDNWWAAYHGATWPNNGGFAGGQKFTIVFAGHMLNDATLLSVGSQTRTLSAWRFGEDEQTFYVTQDDVDRVHTSPREGYAVEDIGTAEWGIRHYTTPEWDDSRWTAAYRQCCTAYAWAGYILVGRMMDLEATYNHDAIFDYVDRYVDTEVGSLRFYTDFAEAMWDAHRSSY